MTRTSTRPPRASAPAPLADAPTYQDVLDEALEETFPASDPIAPAATKTGARVSTRRNPIDWLLEHGPTPAGAHGASSDPD